MSADDKYLDFEISIWEDAGTYRARACSPAGSSAIAPLPAIIGSTGSAANVRLRLENSMLRGTKHIRGVPSSAERHLEEFGHAIFDGLLGPSSPFSALFQASLLIASSQHPRVKGLRLVLGIEAPELAQLPWEYLYDAARHQWLGLSYGSPIVRFLVVDRPSGVIDVDGPLNVLGIIANPGGEWPLLDAEGERNRIEQAMKNLARERRIKFSWAPRGTLRQLRRMVERAKEPWHVFHFIGHGGVPEWTEDQGDSEQEGFLVFAHESGGAEKVSARELCHHLESYHHGMPQLVVLNSCEGACAGRNGRVRSPARALIHAGVPAVVAMQFPISDEAAIQFGEAFYRSLVDNQPLEAALTTARKRIYSECPLEWGIPVLYTRAGGGPLFSGLKPQSGAATSRSALNAPQQAGQNARNKLKALLSRSVELRQ